MGKPVQKQLLIVRNSKNDQEGEWEGERDSEHV